MLSDNNKQTNFSQKQTNKQTNMLSVNNETNKTRTHDEKQFMILISDFQSRLSSAAASCSNTQDQ